jgi:diguanylate cyclase (GGDEF)-like protein
MFVSPFDLNIEGGALERPFKPMIRFGTPVYSSRDEKRGVVILNFLGQHFIDYFVSTTLLASDPTVNMLVNSDGYFLKGMNSDMEWGFMLPDRREKTFARLFPAQWKEIYQHDSGQFLDELGLFTYSTYYPLLEGLRTSSGSPEAFGASARQLNAYQYQWKVVSFTPRKAILSMTESLKVMLLVANAAFVLLGGAGIWIYASAVLRQQDAEHRIEVMAHYDHLTGLPNRPLLYDRLGGLLASAHREQQMFATLFIDLDGFKEINDEFGHKTGDLVLREVAQRLQQCLRETDTAARLGGDEFVVLLASIQKEEDARLIAAKILKSLSDPIPIGKSLTRTIGASIGGAVYPRNGDTQDALMNNADRAMYVAKQSGKNRFHAYSR